MELAVLVSAPREPTAPERDVPRTHAVVSKNNGSLTVCVDEESMIFTKACDVGTCGVDPPNYCV